jgi:hypothetical protein
MAWDDLHLHKDPQPDGAGLFCLSIFLEVIDHNEQLFLVIEDLGDTAAEMVEEQAGKRRNQTAECRHNAAGDTDHGQDDQDDKEDKKEIRPTFHINNSF